MAISIRNPRVEKVARILAARTGTSMTEVIYEALEARAAALVGEPSVRLARLKAIAAACAAAPDLDTRLPDQILGYDDDGVFGHGA
ncbi:MAG: type II toxin-antitoxin system VapB family antitoxin [Spirochaetes bacterium]|nr:type II toxin-antitoxin system VapB family antitoxin [Spirochaetota bacterium]MBU0954262.1 type II toxin-antitoxin system VapB family antitoxin [Spirochaetota bacterium]